MDRIKICSVQVLKNRDLNFKYYYPKKNYFQNEDEIILLPFSDGICKMLSNYTDITSEEFIFTAYLDNRKITMEVDSLINKRLNQQDRQFLADSSAKILNVIAKYYKWFWVAENHEPVL